MIRFKHFQRYFLKLAKKKKLSILSMAITKLNVTLIVKRLDISSI